MKKKIIIVVSVSVIVIAAIAAGIVTGASSKKKSSNDINVSCKAAVTKKRLRNMDILQIAMNLVMMT